MSARRGRGDAAGDEEAGVELKLGEFQNVTTLTLSEARLIIDAIVEHRKKHKIALNETETLTKMRAYLDVFSRFKDREDCDSIDNLLRTRNDLAGFERSQLGTLCCETADEAKTLIPSLQDKISDADLQQLLTEISRLRHFSE
ncbi:putative polymerase ii polypeptide d protein [Lasiodiplodia theobromae]|uniref:Polymerase ii polypeptide d n=4 Tax=Botryosphaeriaceae TaxID=45131 RepID=A0A1J9RBJ3_9PEZI|nr:polymerase ii polypeptide d [Diplodia corticola]XP_035365276.1 RNA polymerase rpb4 [Lasiodiplodia theobromae]KAK0660992.1 DNA-directed RNA polymerase II subunit rpb4 [Lasiodiplodia hormozganensis]KAB2574062.1 DNA-directed RNA polymerase II subunit rpb4 [Lasiodiplodia theobromae]KAF4536575.1 RNA polymerase rpb4 [Lasiodiplodia theobromae]KAF9633709.1 putative polymerase ii polypeptide d protein [Lasiodiplodia theobromae]OJD29819.1 polymerase ii polypeptide d [Diplodia corticola]